MLVGKSSGDVEAVCLEGKGPVLAFTIKSPEVAILYECMYACMHVHYIIVN